MASKNQGVSSVGGCRHWSPMGLVLGLVMGLLLQAGCQSAKPEKPAPVPAEAPPSAPKPVEPAPSKQGPEITFTELVHDFGEISPSSKQVCEFRFKNTGTSTLRLKPKIDATCGCTVPTLSRVNYGPGQTGVIKVTFSAGTSIGAVAKSMTVHSNDPEQAQVRLMIKAKVVQRVVCEPQRLQLRLLDANGACPPISLRSQNGEPFSISKITCSGDTITAAFDPNVQAQSFTLEPVVDMEKLQQRLVGYLLVDVTHPECKQVRIHYNTLREYQFKPAYVMAFNAEPNEPVVKEVDLVNNYGEEFDVQSVSSQRGMVKLLKQDKLPKADGESVGHRLRLSLTPPANLKSGRMFVDVLKVELSNGKSLSLNCRGMYRRQAVDAPAGLTPVRTR